MLEDTEAVQTDSTMYKKMLIRFGIFCGILMVILFILILFASIAHKSWVSGLRSNVASVLSENGAPYIVGNSIPLDSAFDSTCALYSLSGTGTFDDGTNYAVIVRVPTLYGPLPAVYVYNIAQKRASFVGYAALHGKAARHIVDNSVTTQISYWKTRIPDIVGSSIDAAITGGKSK